MTSIALAAAQGQLEVVMNLTARHADLEAKDHSGMTPFAWAAFKGLVEVVEVLAAFNANLEAKDDKYDRTPLALAAEQGQCEAVKDLAARSLTLRSRTWIARLPSLWQLRKASGRATLAARKCQRGGQGRGWQDSLRSGSCGRLVGGREGFGPFQRLP
jgi:hypothetical protein